MAAVQTSIRQEATRTVEAARKVAKILTLWIAFALLFGAVVSLASAISAGWMDDR